MHIVIVPHMCEKSSCFKMFTISEFILTTSRYSSLEKAEMKTSKMRCQIFISIKFNIKTFLGYVQSINHSNSCRTGRHFSKFKQSLHNPSISLLPIPQQSLNDIKATHIISLHFVLDILFFRKTDVLHPLDLTLICISLLQDMF